MSTEKNMNTRMIQKHDIAENWLKATNFIPKQGEFIIYDRDANYAYERFKIGDGVTLVNDLPFVQQAWQDITNKPFVTERSVHVGVIPANAEEDADYMAKCAYDNTGDCMLFLTDAVPPVGTEAITIAVGDDSIEVPFTGTFNNCSAYIVVGESEAEGDGGAALIFTVVYSAGAFSFSEDENCYTAPSAGIYLWPDLFSALSDPYAFTISWEQERIDPKVLPEGGFGYVDNSNIILPVTTLNLQKDTEAAVDVIDVIYGYYTVVDGHEYFINFDGTAYPVTVTKGNEGDYTLRSDECPITAWVIHSQGVDAIAFSADQSYIGTHTVSITTGPETIHKIDSKFIPDTVASKTYVEEKIEAVSEDKYGAIFDSFPSEEEIRTLPNNSFFTVRAYGRTNSEDRIATYYRTTSWTPNALQYTSADGETTIYVVPVNQSVSEVYLPYYGIKTGEENAESNSAIMASLIPIVQYGCMFKFPAGHFYFSEPIDVHDKHISIIGCATTAHKHIPIAGTTFLHFPDLEEGEAALRVAQCTISDFTIFGNQDQYHMYLDRDGDSDTIPKPTVQEVVGVKAYGIKTFGSVIIKDIGIMNFYYGAWCDTANVFITNVSCGCCHYGLSIGNDTKVFNLSGFNVMTLLQMRGDISSAIGVRGDSVGSHLIEITSGRGITLTDLDADFCMNSIVAINGNVGNLIINGVHGRAGVSHFYHLDEDEINANNISATTASEFGVLSVEDGATLDSAVITVNQPLVNNPFDSQSRYNLPFVLLSAGNDTIVKGVQFISASYDVDELTESWAKKRIASLSSLENACLVRVQTSNGSFKYTKSNDIVTVVDDATDIYQRMDKTELALDREVIKTINYIIPDDNGNVNIAEPEIVQSLDECVDVCKTYVLPDGYIYAPKEQFVAGGVKPNFTNQLPIALNPFNTDEILDDVGYKHGVFYKYNGEVLVETSTEFENAYSTGFIPVAIGDTIRINAMNFNAGSGAGYPTFTFFKTGSKYPIGIHGGNINIIKDCGGKYSSTGSGSNTILSDIEIHVTEEMLCMATGWSTVDAINYVVCTIFDTTPPEDVIITVNEEIAYVVTEDGYEYSWENTGKLYKRPDYLNTIAELEESVTALNSSVPQKSQVQIITWTENDIGGGFTQLDYIESIGAQYIDTGISGGSSAAYEIVFDPLAGWVNNYEQYFAGTNCNTPKLFHKFHDDSGARNDVICESDDWAEGRNPSLFAQDSGKHTVTFDGVDMWVDGAKAGYWTPTPGGWGATNWYVFSAGAEPNLCATMRLYSLKMYKDGILARDFVPARRDSDGSIGLYDFASDTFFENAGAGEFIGG